MDWLPVLIGIMIGFVGMYIVLFFYYKSTSVSRRQLDDQVAKTTSAVNDLKVAEEKHKMLLAQHESLLTKSGEKETELSRLLSHTATLETKLSINQSRIQELAEELNQQNTINTAQQQELQQHQKQVIELRTTNQSILEKLETQKAEMLEMQKMSHLQFEKLAQQIFEEKSGKFTEANKSNIEALLKPLGENIEAFKKRVEETYDKESKQRFSLEEKVKDLIENTTKISQEANNLASALKGQTKKQGNWGETILESILEKSGLVKDREYFVQANLKDDDGKNLRPDILVKLPDQRHIVIDSKVSLNAYSRFFEAEEKEQQDALKAAHMHALTQHIDQLSDKKYQDHTDSLDFTIMFVPVEPAYLLAVQTNPDLWSYAYAKRILLISPTNLIAVLKIIADLWKRETQNKHALAIAKEGTNLYEKFVGFLSTMENLGQSIRKSQEVYANAVAQLRDGRGNLISRAEKLKKLGVKSSKGLPPSFTPLDAGDDDDQSQESEE